MPFHICMDEVMMFMSGLPFIGAGILWLRVRIGGLFRRRCSKTCEHDHPAVVTIPEARDDLA